MQIILYIVCLLFFSSLNVNISGAEPPYDRFAFNHRIRVSYYPVEGKTTGDLKASMLERGPIGHQKRRFYAYTLWHFRIGKTRHADLDYVAKGSDLQCNVSVHMPYLFRKNQVDQKLLQRWKSFIKIVTIHESKHVKHAIRACRLLRVKKGDKADLQKSSFRLRRRDASYDSDTNHGFSEGISL